MIGLVWQIVDAPRSCHDSAAPQQAPAPSGVAAAGTIPSDPELRSFIRGRSAVDSLLPRLALSRLLRKLVAKADGNRCKVSRFLVMLGSALAELYTCSTAQLAATPARPVAAQKLTAMKRHAAQVDG